ncbi:MAG: type VI secretion system tube protein Hcp [Burkholderiales bacterium]
MAIGLFLKCSGCTGESENKEYTNWTHCSSFSWGVSQPSSMERGGGGSAGLGTFADLVVTAMMDKAYPDILEKCASGDHLGKVELAGAKMGGNQWEYMKITLEDVLVTSVSVSGSDGAEVIVAFGFQGSKLTAEYSPQTAKGTKGATIPKKWDVKKNTK